MKKSDIFWQTYLNLEREALEVSKYIFFTDEVLVNSKGSVTAQSCNTQLEAFSPYIADLLVRCCVQIEAISKELYFDNGGTKARGDSSILFDEDCLKLIDIKWKTHNKTVTIVAPSFNFTKDENRILKPLKEAHKRQGTYWEKAYQAVKHDRYSSLHKGNVKAFIQALAALFLLNVYYRNDSWVTSQNDVSKIDYSLGSAIFTVSPPAMEQLWYGNNPIYGESPYIAKYKDEDFKRIEDIQKAEEKALNEYWISQPELKEKDFLVQLQEAEKRESRVMGIWELSKYRLNKKAPAALAFEERKKLLVCSEEWQWYSTTRQTPTPADELTEENIQEVMDSIAISWGSTLMIKYQKLEWTKIAFNSNICGVYID